VKYPRLIILEGPSGVGKHALLLRLKVRRAADGRSLVREFAYYTSRPMRPGEVDGENYRFRTVEEIKRLAALNPDFLTAWVYTDLHGVDLRDLRDALQRSDHVCVIIQCARPVVRKLKEHFPDGRTIFLSPVSSEELWAISEHDTVAACRALQILRGRRDSRSSVPPADALLREVEAVFQMAEAKWHEEIVVNPTDKLEDVQAAFLRAALPEVEARTDSETFGHASSER
jgi:guanylate kinase